MGNKKTKYPARLFGVLLQEIFDFLYIRHSDFAEKIDVDCSTISAWTTSKQKPRSIKIEPIVSTITGCVHAFPENKKKDLKKMLISTIHRVDLPDDTEEKILSSNDYDYIIRVAIESAIRYNLECRKVDVFDDKAKTSNKMIMPDDKIIENVNLDQRADLLYEQSLINHKKAKLVVFDVDGTLIKGIRHSWTLLWNVLGVDNKDQIKRKRDFVSGKLSYQEWTRLDCRDLVENKLHLSHFDKIINSGKCSLTKNLIPAITKLRENGVLTAIISGGVDTLLYKLIPEVEMLFNEIFINRFVYSEAGYLQGINATEYDWDDNKLGVAGKNRGLQRICEKYGIPIESSVFVGDDLNDLQAMKEAGSRIFYCGDYREFNEQLPHDIIIIPKNDLMIVANRVLNELSESAFL